MQGHVTNKNLYIFTARVLLQPKLDRMMTSLDGLFYKVAWPFDHVVLQGYVTYEIHYIYTTRVSIGTKLDKIVTYRDGWLLIYSPESLIAWSC